VHTAHGLEDTTSSWAPDEFVFSPQVSVGEMSCSLYEMGCSFVRVGLDLAFSPLSLVAHFCPGIVDLLLTFSPLELVGLFSSGLLRSAPCLLLLIPTL
jgi:hypothetical protein